MWWLRIVAILVLGGVELILAAGVLWIINALIDRWEMGTGENELD